MEPTYRKPKTINLPKRFDMDNELCRNSGKIEDNNNETGNESSKTNRQWLNRIAVTQVALQNPTIN